MSNENLELFNQYKWLIPDGHIPLTHVIEIIKTKYSAIQIESGSIPLLKMHKYNAVHLPRNEWLGLTEEEMNIKAIQIRINEQTIPYIKKNFVPLHSINGNFIYLVYEEQVGYKYSNSNRLYLEVQLMQGVPSNTADSSEDMMDFWHYLRSYNESYGMMLHD